MESLKTQLKKEAVRKHGKIYPSGNKISLDECFTITENQILFWFNTESNTTKVLSREINN